MQHVGSMATELNKHCPICLDGYEEVSYVTPCLHQFCYLCILQWAERKPECPLCKGRIFSIINSVQADDDFEEHVVTPSLSPPFFSSQAERSPGSPAAHSLHCHTATQPQPAGRPPRAPVGGLQNNTWASLFGDHPDLLQPLLTWVQQELGRIFANERSQADTVEGLVMSLLVLFGLDEDLLVRLLESSLQNHTVTFVHQLIDVAAEQCSSEAHRLLSLEDGNAATGQEGSPVAATGPTASQEGSPTPGMAPSVSLEETDSFNLPSTSAAARHGDPGSRPSAPVPIAREQEEPQEAVADPSPSSQGSERSLWDPRRPLKRRAGSPKASSAAKRPPQRQC